MTDRWDGEGFTGAKLALFIGESLLVYLRDDLPHIPFPAHWDFPGGGREGDETPEACALRETCEEFGLTVPPRLLRYRVRHLAQPGNRMSWFFAAHLPASVESAIRFGDEGQFWRLIPPRAYAVTPRAIPHLAGQLQRYLDGG